MRAVVIGLILGLVGAGGPAIATDGVDEPVTVGGSPAERRSCPPSGASGVRPVPVAGDVRSFTDDEFQRIVDLTGPAGISAVPPPPILGDAVADARIGAIAEARGYRRRDDRGGVGLVSVGGRLVDAPTAEAWRAMAAAAAGDGIVLTLWSGYRSEARQRSIFVGKLAARGHGASSVRSGRADGAIDAVLRFSSIPGYSRHHTGRTVDVVSPGFGLSTFHRSAAYRWLSRDDHRNARRHGFVPSYPPDAGLQGPEPEPWEYVYVGVETLQEWSDLAVVDPVSFGDGTIVFTGAVADPLAELVLHLDDHPVARATGWCSPGAAPGTFRLVSPFETGDDACLVQLVSRPEVAGLPERRLLVCGP